MSDGAIMYPDCADHDAKQYDNDGDIPKDPSANRILSNGATRYPCIAEHLQKEIV